MAECIEREAVFSAIWKTSAEHDVFFPAIILDAIKTIPAADVRPVVKAVWKHVKWVVDEEWQEGGYWISRCSNCSMPYHAETPFCPNCGADMREPPKEETC